MAKRTKDDPLSTLPGWAQQVSAFFPGRYAVEAIQAAVTGTARPQGALAEVVLILNGVAGVTAAIFLFRWEAGDITAALPLKVRLTLGVRDVLHIKNNDSVPHYLGAIAIKPGKALHLPFEYASQREFTSSAHFGGKLTVVVEPWPDPGTARLRWRTLELVQAIRHY